MFNKMFNKINTNKPLHVALIVLVLYVVLSLFMKHCRTSGFLGRLSPATLDISTPASKQVAGGLFGLDYSLQCVPGPQATASPYTIGLNPGGVCGAQEYVNSQADYVITGSNGGASLTPELTAEVNSDLTQ